MQTPCQVEVAPFNPEGIEPFIMVNSPPCQVEAMSLHLINTPSGQVGVTLHHPEGIKPFMVNSPLCQVRVTLTNKKVLSPSPWSTLCQVKLGLCHCTDQHTIRSIQGHPFQSRRYLALHHSQLSTMSSWGHPSQSEGIEPINMVNSLPCQVVAMSSHLINTPLGPLRVASSIFSQVSISDLPCVAPVSPLTSSTSVLVPITDGSPPVTSPPCVPLSLQASSAPLKTMQAMSHKQPVDLPNGSDCP